ncbi:DUF2971 domain-containing protein [Pseudomonas aeruginosa]|uniref:DUF2971 domain-containing protein n=2 Tax=Gammaproteobacteria TaxID=1236 RepID=UPI000692581C|nr:DUF2971 domain-containing protein [Pseudomonas aeruginosa]EIU7189495.1 DUF2971 domain-containing protein [Pseudomonas aeruginosa]MBF1869553.1 DUF2971 domain-containing protein [Pseudomonas aeruginosa]MBG6575401.1 DUF2971 domain-containing protein [Pseudomonas aeruginosa]MBH9373165.1 DUF2971 domain-containing protein [Pseudomonas aeruginosa]MBU5928111.1 DUF2971 domain-containing protein [Pseudomonas aeruginosa]
MGSTAVDKGFLYRIVRFDHAVEVLKGNLHFSHPSSWDDPYETHIKHEFDHAIFGQCWTKSSVSDAMWRIYSPNMLGVRLRTTREKLESAMQSYTKNNPGFKRRLRDVEYLRPIKYRDKVAGIEQQMQLIVSSPSLAADMLCLKRDAFKHENEVRAILYNGNAERIESARISPIKVGVNGRELIQQIVFDPRAPDELCNAMKHYLKEIVNFKGEVKKSKLYTVKPSKTE